MITAIKELLDRCTEADVLMINGHGVSHPRRFGIASHVGVVLDKPSIGIAKKILYGSVVKIDKENRSLLVVNGSVVGFVLENAYGGKIYVSVGHRVSPEDALKIVEKVWSRDKTLPDPLFIADKLTKKLRNKL